MQEKIERKDYEEYIRTTQIKDINPSNIKQICKNSKLSPDKAREIIFNLDEYKLIYGDDYEN